MKQYLTHTDYALWEVIVSGDAPVLIALVSGGAEAAIHLKTTKQKIARRNELKAKSTLLLPILDEHLLKFHEIKDAKTLWEAIKTRFGGNKEFKKMKKTILKQQYENFAASRSEVSGGVEAAIHPKTTEQNIARRNELKAKSTLLLAILDEHLLKFHGIKDAKTLWEAIKTMFGGNKESKKIKKTILNQLEIHGEVISQEYANLKLLRSRPPAWNTHTLITRNKSDLDTLSMDDLHNNLKVYEAKIK
nr:ribonuclease H-like domain-containing protein [Tanacetum cinerariifolium]